MHRRITPSLLIAVLALAVAVGGGTAYAASKYIITSTKQIKPSVRKALKGNTGPRGPQGAAGPAGPAGAQGPAGPSVLSGLNRIEAAGTIAAGAVDSLTVTCPPGQGVVSGGFAASSGVVFFADTFGATNAWSVGIDNAGSAVAADATAIAFCANSGQAVAPRSGSREDKVAAAVAARRAEHS